MGCSRARQPCSSLHLPGYCECRSSLGNLGIVNHGKDTNTEVTNYGFTWLKSVWLCLYWPLSVSSNPIIEIIDSCLLTFLSPSVFKGGCLFPSNLTILCGSKSFASVPGEHNQLTDGGWLLRLRVDSSVIAGSQTERDSFTEVQSFVHVQQQLGSQFECQQEAQCK